MATTRIQWIDFVKGLSIIYIVSLHTQGFFNFQGAYISFMSVFFLISGMLFNEEKPIKAILVSKVNSLLMPFVIYYLIGCVVYYLVIRFFPEYSTYSIHHGEVDRAQGIFDVFVRRQYFNGPIWFILCLFWCELYFVPIAKFVKPFLQPVIVLILGAAGWMLGGKGVFLPMMMDVGMTVLPVFYCGYLLRKCNYLSKPVKAGSFLLLLMSTLTAVLIIYFYNPGIHIHYNAPHGNPILVLILAFVSSFTIVQAARMIYHYCGNCVIRGHKVVLFPVLQYLGRGTLIILGFHHLIYRPLVVLGIQLGNVLFIATLTINILMIPLINRFVPILGGKYNTPATK